MDVRWAEGGIHSPLSKTELVDGMGRSLLEYGTRPRFEDSTGTDGLEPWLPCCCLKKNKTEVEPRSFWNSFHEKVAFNYHTASKKRQQKSDELVLDKRPLASQPR